MRKRRSEERGRGVEKRFEWNEVKKSEERRKEKMKEREKKKGEK